MTNNHMEHVLFIHCHLFLPINNNSQFLFLTKQKPNK